MHVAPQASLNGELLLGDVDCLVELTLPIQPLRFLVQLLLILEQRLALLEACFGRPTMGEVTKLSDDILAAGFHRLLARAGQAREPGEEG